MKNYIFIPAIFLFFTTLFFPFSPASAQCKKSAYLYQHYEWEIRNMAMLRINKFNHPDKLSVKIPEVWQDTIWEALTAVYDAEYIPERDSMFDIFCIHHYTSNWSAPISSIALAIDSSYHWTQQWSVAENITGNAYVDSLMSSIEFEVQPTIFPYRYVDLYFQHPINAAVLATYLAAVPGIKESLAGNIYAGDGDLIIYKKEGNIRHFDFSAGLGDDCPVGCLYRIVWGFDVYPDCYVVYTGRTVYQNDNYPASPVPHQNCNITPASEVALPVKSNLFAPNPFSGSLSLLSQDDNLMPSRILIADWSGRIVYENTVIFQGLQISTAAWPAGVYTVQAVYPESRVGVQQLVKSN